MPPSFCACGRHARPASPRHAQPVTRGPGESACSVQGRATRLLHCPSRPVPPRSPSTTAAPPAEALGRAACARVPCLPRPMSRSLRRAPHRWVGGAGEEHDGTTEHTPLHARSGVRGVRGERGGVRGAAARLVSETCSVDSEAIRFMPSPTDSHSVCASGEPLVIRLAVPLRPSRHTRGGTCCQQECEHCLAGGLRPARRPAPEPACGGWQRGEALARYRPPPLPSS